MNSGPRYCDGPICRAIRSMQQRPADPECEDNQDTEYYSAEEDPLGGKESDPCLSEASDDEDAIFTPTSSTANNVSGQSDDDNDEGEEKAEDEAEDDDEDDDDDDTDDEEEADDDDDDHTDNEEEDDEDDEDDTDDEDDNEDDLDDNIPARLHHESHARINAWLLTCEW